ncbi:uncharacterized protein LOC102702344 [Oryza brachyantha]|nr:uncharacterized protein LOC102702344 [Oryza brachyantha]
MSLPEDSGTTIVSVDAPSNMLDYMVAAANDLPRILEKVIQCKKHNYFRVYDYAGRCLKNSYQKLYTKHNLRICLYAPSGRLICKITNCQHSSLLKNVVETMFTTIFVFLVTLYNVFPFLPALIALVLLMAADKGGQLHTSSRSSADVTVSYILLVGALILEVSSSAMIIFSIFKPKLAAKNIILPEWTRSKQWSEKLAQYNMIKAVQADHHTKASCISNCLVAKCAGLLCSLTHKTITVDLGQTPIKEFILDNLLDYGLRKEWSCSSSRGHLVLQRWINGSYQHPGSALPKSTSGSVDFPTSVLIWHIATDICYYGEIESGGGGAATTSSSSSSSTSSSDQLKDQKEMSRQLSNYVMHLVFKRGVMLTSKSQLVHDKVCADLGGDEKDAIVKLFETNIEEKKKQATDIDEEQAGLNSTEAKVHIHSASPATTTPSSKHAQKLELLRRAEAALHHPVMSDAREVAKVLGAIGGEANRWGLIAGVWAEMLYYIAPRAGAAFHYESLSTGGEFITHLLFIMRLLGPFMPTPDGASSSSSSSAP